MRATDGLSVRDRAAVLAFMAGRWLIAVVVVVVLLAAGGGWTIVGLAMLAGLVAARRPVRTRIRVWWLTRQGWSSEDAAVVVSIRGVWPVAVEYAGLVVCRADGSADAAYIAQTEAVPAGVRLVIAMPRGVNPAALDGERLASALALPLTAGEVVTAVHAAVTVVLRDPAAGTRTVELSQQRWETGDPWGGLL